MNLSNKLTTLRVILIPFFVIFLILDIGRFDRVGDFIALAIFVIASITDFLDGYLARKNNMVTNFGKFMDPLADKLLVGSAAICLIEMGRLSAWVVVILIAREFIISGFRLVAANNGRVIAAGIWGKIKTVVQLIMTIALIAHFDFLLWHILEQILIWASLILTIISLVDYIYHNQDVLKDTDN